MLCNNELHIFAFLIVGMTNQIYFLKFSGPNDELITSECNCLTEQKWKKKVLDLKSIQLIDLQHLCWKTLVQKKKKSEFQEILRYRKNIM